MDWKRGVGLGLCAVAAAALLLRYTPVLDPDLRASPKPADLAARFHSGPGPCLRYHDGKPDPAKVAAAAARLHAAGVDHTTLGGLVGALFARARERELPLHPMAEEDEWVEAILSASSAPQRLAGHLKRDRLRAVLAQVLDLQNQVPIKLELAYLPPPQRAAIDATWDADPALLLVSGLIPVIAELEELETKSRLDALARLIGQLGSAPDQLSDLGLPPEQLVDGWEREIVYERHEGRVVLTSVGNPDGTLDTREVAVTSRAPPPCVAPGEVTLLKKTLGDALDDPNDLAASARVVPHFKDGAVVGHRVFAIRAGSLLDQAGLCNGDVVKAINGHPLTTAEETLKLYSLVREANELEVTLVRAGADAAVKIHLR